MKEERQKNYQIAVRKQVEKYMRDGGKGDLDLENTPITSLPKDLKVGGSLDLSGTPLAKRYTKEELKKMLPGVRGGIYS